MQRPIDTTTIAAQYWSPSLAEEGQVVENTDDINQCLRIILQTPQGSDPHRPTFASRVHEFVDWPQSSVRNRLVRECFEAITTWEPRINVDQVNVQFNPDGNNVGQVQVDITWSLKVGSATGTTSVLLG